MFPKNAVLVFQHFLFLLKKAYILPFSMSHGTSTAIAMRSPITVSTAAIAAETLRSTPAGDQNKTTLVDGVAAISEPFSAPLPFVSDIAHRGRPGMSPASVFVYVVRCRCEEKNSLNMGVAAVSSPLTNPIPPVLAAVTCPSGVTGVVLPRRFLPDNTCSSAMTIVCPKQSLRSIATHRVSCFKSQ